MASMEPLTLAKGESHKAVRCKFHWTTNQTHLDDEVGQRFTIRFIGILEMAPIDVTALQI